MADEAKSPRLAVTAILAGLATLLWLAPVVILAVIVPLYKPRFDEYGMQPPVVTKGVLAVWDIWWSGILFVQFALLAAVAGYFVRHQSRSRAARVVWRLFAFALPLVVLVLTAGSVFLAELKLQEGLNK